MNELTVIVENVNGILVTTSNRVAEELGVQHKHLLEKIDVYVNKFSSAETSAQFYIPSNYKDRSGKANRNYLITKKGIAQLIGGYSAAVPKAFDLNVAYINRFEEMEKQLQGQFKVPTSFKEALQLALEQQEKIEAMALENKIKNQQIAELKPKGTYYDLVLQCKNLLSITVIAKDYGKSGQWLNEKLHELGVQYKQGNVWLLYQKYADKGYTQSKTQPITRSTGLDVVLHTYWTQKGRLFIYELLKSVGILPNIEKENVA
ncbi:hypothetical protein IX317_001667 [Fusobacterium sp. DD29]|uniref:phage regulatory protein/antirepressor Ant n=1 Tax=unclassified Fusobacterium TaxID=2648384 RepID=UPI001B8B7DDC|nr:MULTISPECIES: phage regulatory protein/antirepressor Ant [unclassified Fusobacterium]MBR8701659.1 hypothetical protein [Fusobacterium sp. DD45]MBR8711440.1 hypothetical protein [Fusobacterium sp. DD28]MBR8749987.1 hypothetical protein [Fusobacterium sp. DD29]MBR8751989.1 hypothetical protein [Fusobacterium sp. DD26]MBR8762200.1 hypothetical protein [Fusobacterium sp. DD25]